jgi:predicted nucleic acid-binding protein
MRIALDTNVLVYAEAANGALMRDRALKLIQLLPPGAILLPVKRWANCSMYLFEKPSGARVVREKLC